MKILLVEDDIILGELLQECLLRLNHEMVRHCVTGAEACRVIAEESFDCAFVDLRLPDTDGLTLLERLKQEDPGLPVVMMSGYPTLEYTIEAMRKGASDFLTKPFTLEHVALTTQRISKERGLLLENLSLQLECQARKELEKVNIKLQDRISEQTRLFRISRELDEIHSSDDLYARIVQLASSMETVDKASFLMVPHDRDGLLPIAGCGCGTGGRGPHKLPLNDQRLKDVLGNGASHILIPSDQAHQWMGGPTAPESLLSCWPMRIRGEPFGVLMALHKPGCGELSSEEKQLFDFLIRKASMAVENMALYESLISNFYGILKSLVTAIEAKDLYTGKHSERVTRYAVETARLLGCSGAQIEALDTIGYLHDIGKIGISDGILNKPASLSTEEYEIIKKHPVIGEAIVADLGLSREEKSIIRHHHERWDGNGYPDGLGGEDIPLLARIVSLADAFDAMTSKRAYRDAISRTESIAELLRNSGRQFDPVALEAFVEMLNRTGAGKNSPRQTT
jgi:putative nucleotidyltransferase with HDIG domain